MRSAAAPFALALAMIHSACGEPAAAPPAAIPPDTSVSPQLPESLHEQLAMFFRLEEGGDGPRMDSVSGVGLWPWQRTGFGAYSQMGSGTQAVPAAIGSGQHIDGAEGHHFATSSHAAMDHASGSFTWTAWVSLDAPEGPVVYVDPQTLVAKWNGIPDTHTVTDHREYRLWHDADASRWNFEVSRDGLEGAEHSRVVEHPQHIERGQFYFVEAWHDAEAETLNLRVSDDRARGETASAEWSDGVFVGQADLDVGAQNTCTNAHLQGTIDALGYWNRVLSEQESAALWNEGAGAEL